MRRVAAAKWLGPEIPLPRHIRPAQESISKTADRALCLNWLKSQMEASEKRPKKVDDFFEEAKQKFKVTVRTFRALWDQAIDETESYEWRRPGRSKKS
jgi:hypothetical protein